MKKFRGWGTIFFALAMIVLGGVYAVWDFSANTPISNAQSYGREIANQVIFVTYEDGDENWLNSQISSYQSTPLILMQNSYNDSSSSVENYYKTQSYNSLDLKSNFITKNGYAVKVPYTKKELLPYSKSNTTGYLKYEICSYSTSSAPSIFSTDYFGETTHLFSCYDCENDLHNGSSGLCDLDASDDIACICAYYKYCAENPSVKVECYEHLDRYIREQCMLKSALNDISFDGANLDSDGDGKIDSITFIFEGISETVGWSDLLWAHKYSIIDFSSYASIKPYFKLLLQSRGVRDVQETDFSDKLDILTSSVKKNEKTCYNYNLYLFSDLLINVPNYGIYRLTGADGKEIISNFTLAHELGHVLGLPDFYVYNDDEREDPVWIWDLMAYAYDGVPTYLTTYSREKLGFLSSQNIVQITYEGEYTLSPTCYDEVYNNGKNSGNVLAYVYEDENHPGQKIYIEYRSQEGVFESGLNTEYLTKGIRKDGIIVYRVDENVVQASGHSGGVAHGNYYGYPYNLYVFRDGSNYTLNETFTTIENITFQSYDSSLNQKELSYSDVTFIDSGLKIEFVSLSDGGLTFKISGGELEQKDTRDISQIELLGDAIIAIEVKGSYIDAGINYGEFSESEFNITIKGNVNTSVLGTYTYEYCLTLKADTSKTITLTRTVKIVDTTPPKITLVGDKNVIVENITDFDDQGVSCEDNYYSYENLYIEKSDYILLSDNYYKIVYTVTDGSGNSAYVERFILVKPKTDFSSIKLIGDETVYLEVKTDYVDGGIDYGDFAQADFEKTIKDNVNINVINKNGYTYVYTLIYNSTGESLTLSRKVVVLDTTAPTIILEGGDLAFSKVPTQINDKWNYYDNYDSQENLLASKSNIIYVNQSQYKIVYTVTDKSGNTTQVTRLIFIQPDLFSSIALNGSEEVTHEVCTVYSDLYINFGIYTEDDFEIKCSDNIDISIISRQAYTYTLTYKNTGEELTFTRYINVIDDIQPQITLRGDSVVELYRSKLATYKDMDVDVEDNYTPKNDILIFTRMECIDDNTYRYYYKAQDECGNVSEEIFRTLLVIIKPIESFQLTLKLNGDDYERQYDIDKTIKFKVDIDFTIDNDQDQIIKFFINGEKISETKGRSFSYVFPKAGIYKIKVQVGDNASVEKTINIIDNLNEEPVDMTLTYYLAGGGGFFLITSIIIICSHKKRKVKDLEKY